MNCKYKDSYVYFTYSNLSNYCVSFYIFILKTELVKTYAHCQNAETMNQILYLRKF